VKKANLIKEPFTRLGAVRSVANQIGETFTKSYAVDFSAIVIVAIWTFLFIFLSLALLKKRDL
jgi:ABC-2 type transport system permease protein